MDMLLAAEARATRRILRMLMDDFWLEQAIPESISFAVLGPICEHLRRGKVPTAVALQRLSRDQRYQLRLEATTACGYRRLEMVVHPLLKPWCKPTGTLQRPSWSTAVQREHRRGPDPLP